MTRGCGWEGLLSAKQAFGGFGVAQRRKQKINCGPGGIDGPVQVAPATLNSNVSLVHAPGLVSRLKMAPEPLLEFGRIALYPAPHGGMIRFQAAFLQQLLHVPKRQGITQVPADRAKNKLRFCLSPLEDRWSGCHHGVHSAYQHVAFKSCNTTSCR